MRNNPDKTLLLSIKSPPPGQYQMKRILIVWGGMEFHEPRQTSERFAKALSARGYEVHVTDQLSKLDDAEGLAAFDLIVINMTMGEITDQQEANLLAAIRAGTGLA